MAYEQTELCRLAEKHGAGKQGSVRLTAFYDGLLKDRREDVRKVLEIGVGSEACMWPGYRPGASLFMWEEYFPNAEIYAIDIAPEVLFSQGRIHSFLCDQSDAFSLLSLRPLLGYGFDFIVDDGSHVPEHQMLTANLLMPLLGPRGIYCIEDIIPSRQREVEAGIFWAGKRTELIDKDGAVGDVVFTVKMEENQ